MTLPEDLEPESVVNRIEGGVSGTAFQVGQLTGDVFVGGRTGTRSRYRDTVREIAPRLLTGRAVELAELDHFCSAPDPSPQYAWWRAEAWTGKTALLSSFVLNPPEKVRLVSFFITARLAGYDTRADFLAVVLPQLSEMLRIEVPEGDGPSNFRGLLVEAAELCASRDERLVLIVDGLDEDRGAGEAGGANSIAALLPRDPAHGLRVVVAGRPNPALPDVLADDHPLRDPEIVRVLAPSAAATEARKAMENDLDRLLGSEAAEARAVLGLLVSARGGLSGQDLVELVGLTREKQVRLVLNSVEGRAFSRRPARWKPAEAPEVYLLGHETLQPEATGRLGPAEMRTYAERIIEWAEGYRALGWPPSTPQFLLQGYPRLLQETGRIDLVIECVTDLARQDRLLHVTGGEAASQGEVAAAHAMVSASAEPDVLDVLRVTMHQDALKERNARTPARLPALWARLGEVDHAEALARSISDPDRRFQAVAELVDVLAETDAVERATRLIEEAVDEEQSFHCRVRLARAVAANEKFVEAKSIVKQIADPDWTCHASVLVATIENPDELEPLFALAAKIKTTVLRLETVSYLRSLRIVREFSGAIDISASMPWERDLDVIGRIVRGFAAAGDFASARRVAESRDEGRSEELLALLEIFAMVDDNPDFVLFRVNDIGDTLLRRRVTVGLIAFSIDKGFFELAGSLVGRLSEFDSAANFYSVLRAYGSHGLYENGLALVEQIVWSSQDWWNVPSRAGALTALAEGILLSGDIDKARLLAHEAELLARQGGRSLVRDRSFRKFVELVVSSHDVVAAERLARVCTEAEVAQGDVADISRLVAEAGDLRLAEDLAFRLDDLSAVAETLVVLLRRLRRSGADAEVRRLATKLEETLGDTKPGQLKGSRRRSLVACLCAAGLVRRALEWANAAEGGYERTRAYQVVVKELCAIGDIDAAVECVREGIADRTYGADLSRELAEGLAEARRVDGLEILADLGLAKGSAARIFIERLAEHDGARALELAKSSLDSSERKSALLAIAARTTEPLRSEVLVELALGGDWSQVLPVLSRADHPGLAEVVDHYLRLQEARFGLRSPGA